MATPTQPDSMVERVARAIYSAEADSEDLEIGSPEWCDRMARAALSALDDEVTEAMLRAAYLATDCPIHPEGPGPANREFFTKIYRAMNAARRK